MTELKTEMSIDTKQLSEQNTIKTLSVTKTILDKKLQQIQEENRNLELNMKEERLNLNKLGSELDTIKDEIRQLDAVEITYTDKKYESSELISKFTSVNFFHTILILFFSRELVRSMLEEKEELRQKEIQFKDHCRQELARLQKELQ